MVVGNDDMDRSSATDKNSYLQLRQQKISRNLSRLKDLGLMNPVAQAAYTGEAKPHDRKRKIASIQIATRETRRRSQRLQSNRLDSDERFKPAEVTQPQEKLPAFKVVQRRSKEIASAETKIFPSNAARSIALDLNKVTANFLGIEMQATGKAHVMNECGLLSANCTNVSFNKYSGVQEWGNSVFFLWVNLEAPQSTVINEFSNGAIAWFGGSRMHDATPVIQRLQHAKSGTVMLWCRKHYGRPGFGPYVCLGRLSLSSYDPNSHPLAFKWKLLDYQQLVASKPSAAILEDFRFIASSK